MNKKRLNVRECSDVVYQNLTPHPERLMIVCYINPWENSKKTVFPIFSAIRDSFIKFIFLNFSNL